MMRKTMTAMAGAIVLTALSIGATSAAPFSQSLSAEIEAGGLVQKVHACHNNVQQGQYGWHYHSGYNCRRIAASPPRQHYRPHYGPQCRRECKYVGPIKICKDRCR
jgi:hypothetical protein